LRRGDSLASRQRLSLIEFRVNNTSANNWLFLCNDYRRILSVTCNKVKTAVLVPVFRGFFHTNRAFFAVQSNGYNSVDVEAKLAAAFCFYRRRAAARRQIPLWRNTAYILNTVNRVDHAGVFSYVIFAEADKFFVQGVHAKLVSGDSRHGRRHSDFAFY
jgi:transposase-like protein